MFHLTFSFPCEWISNEPGICNENTYEDFCQTSLFCNCLMIITEYLSTCLKSRQDTIDDNIFSSLQFSSLHCYI